MHELLARILIQIKIPNKLYDGRSVYWKNVDYKDIQSFVEFVKISHEKKYAWSYIKMIVDEYITWNQEFHWVNYMQLHEMFPCETESNADVLTEICKNIVESNAAIVADYKKGKKNAINSLKGQVMKQTKGKADMNMVTSILENLLK